MAKNASATKSGPGRFHRQGHIKASPPRHVGADASFVLHQASTEKKARRKLIAVHGRRSAIRQIKQWNRDLAAHASSRAAV